MLHEIMQACLAEGRWDDQWIKEKTDAVVREGMDSLVRLNISTDVAKIEIQKRSSGLKAFSERFIGNSPKVSDIVAIFELSNATTSPTLL